MKLIAFANDHRGMAIRFLSQEIRLKRPGCSIMVVKYALETLPEADFIFFKHPEHAIGGTIYHLKDTESIKDYYTEIMALLPEILL